MQFVMHLKGPWSMACVLTCYPKVNSVTTQNALVGRLCYSTPFVNADKDYYSILEVPRKATQAQIKSAYYKLSMKYHPDQNQGNKEAHIKFVEIGEAYAALGQVESRRKYDIELGFTHPRARPSSVRRQKFTYTPQPNTSQGPQFNFDEFYKAHYGHSKHWKKQQQWEAQQKTEVKHPPKVTGVPPPVWFALTFAAASVIVFVLSGIATIAIVVVTIFKKILFIIKK